nr:hypothetical protein CFP56_62698 [Quercus suber]
MCLGVSSLVSTGGGDDNDKNHNTTEHSPNLSSASCRYVQRVQVAFVMHTVHVAKLVICARSPGLPRDEEAL